MSNPLIKITLLGAIAFITIIFVATRPQPVQAAGQVPVFIRAFPNVAPVKLYGGSNNILRTFAPTITVVNSGPDTDATNNDYRRIQNALNSAVSGDTIILDGTFNFTASNAAAAWAQGNDNTAGTADDYEVLVPPGLSNVTLTANNLGDATIQGPGDLAGVNLEGFLVFDSFDFHGAGQGWTISNLQIFDFDLSIGMFASATTDYNNTTIQNNLIRIASDLNATVAPADVNQNIGIHLSFGTNQTVSGNTIQMPGNGVSDSANSNFSSEVGLQSNTSGGSVYDGLSISNNAIHVLNAQSANPETILGIWENSHGHASNITISGNSFVNDAVGNSPSLNLQRAFRVTSHSGASSLVKYDSNIINGANIGFQWIAGSDFSGNQAVVLTGNQIIKSGTGVLIQSNGIAHFENNAITGSGSGGGIRLTTGSLTGSPATFPANANSIYRTSVSEGSGYGVWIEGTAGSVAPLSQNDLSGNANEALRNESAPSITAENNWWGNNLAANVAAKTSGNADFDPWLASGTDVNAAVGFQPFTYANTSGTITTFVGTAGADTGSLLAGDPITMTMNGDTATTPVAQLLNFDIQLGGSDDVFTLGLTSIPTVFDGGAGNDTLVGTNFAQTWNITGADSGNIPGATSSFSSVEALRGGTAADSFIFGASGTISQIVNGDLGSDTLDNSAIPGHTITPGGPGSLDGRTGSATGVGLSFDNINNFSPSPSSVTGTKTVTGTFAPNGSITYSVVLANSSAFAQLDNPGDEFVDVLPAGLTLVSGSANSGTAVANTGTNTVTWNGSIFNGASVTITMNATVNSNAGGTTISNQGTIFYDADGNGTNEATSLTDDPSTVAANDPTTFSVCANNVIVTTSADSGAGSLRQAIADVCPGSTITFDMNQVLSPITLASELVINKNLTITGPGASLLTISGNNASRVINIQSGTTVAVSGVTIANGKVISGNSAGGVLNKGTLTLTNCTVSGNSAANGGGGISNNGDNGTAVLTINNCTVSGNTAPSFGAGILSSGFHGSATLNIFNSTISGNGTPSFGGGIYNFGDAGIANLNITNSTVSGNSAASSGGGIFNQGNGGSASITLSNALISDNSGPNAANGPDILSQLGGTVSGNNNLIQTSTGYTISGSNNINGDPKLEKDGLGKPLLKNNGGPTQTIALLVGSPALDAGSNTAANNAGLTTDQRGPGFARIVDGADADTTDTVDIGAFEAQLSLQDITDKTTNEDTQLQFTFSVGGGASITSVTATSANTTLVPNNAANIDVSGSGSTRTLTINPVADLSGTSTITVTVTGSSETMTDTFVLTVNPVNDVPSFIKGANQTVNEDAGAQSQVNWATSISPGPNESGQTVSFTATNDNNALFSAQPAISPTGTLTYTPAANANGSTTVSVTLKDNGGTANGGVDTSAAQTFTITVNPVADTPSVTNATTTLNTQTTSGLVISRNVGDGAEVTNFKITNIQHGTLFKNNGTTQINEGDFITVAEGNAGLKFSPASNLISPATTFSFDVNASLNSSDGGIGGGTTTATITVNCGSTVVINNANNGPGSLRAVINSACAGSVITFDMNQVISPITLTSGELLLDRSLTFQGPGANLLTIRRSSAAGTPLFSIFHILDPSLTTSISGLTLSNADNADNGGAVSNLGTLTMNSVTLSNNHTAAGGSAIFNGETGNTALTNSTISGNQAESGAIFNLNGVMTISNTTLSGNTNLGDSPGAAIFSNVEAVTTVTNCTISQNTGQEVVVFRNGVGPGDMDLKNTIVSGNTGGNVSGITDASNNLIGGAPLLAPLGNYGGPTQTMALLPGSPAINAGTSTGAAATDQRGISRVGAVDIGAFESRGFTIAATSGGGQTTPILTAFASPLTATVTSAFTEPVTGGLVTFNAPASGASSTFPGNVTTSSVSINATGAAVLAPTANSIAGGPYDVVAGLGTGQPSVNFALTNAKANQTITFGSLPNKIASDPDFSVSATASSGLTVSFAASGQCTVAGTTVHLTGAGSCTITASQAGNSNFNAAPDVPRTFTIAKANQTITFGSLPNKIAGDPDFSVSATASSGLSVSFAASGQCTIAGTTVHLTGAGSCTITASQAGDSNFNAAPDVPRSFTIAGPLVSLSQTNYNVNESTGFVAITVNRAGDLSVPVTVDYATDDTGSPNICSTLNSGLAAARCDFGLILGTLRFAATETQKTFVIPITQDSFTEGPETFTVSLSNVNGSGASLATPTSATVTINDSAAPAQNASDDTDAFVRQQYRDFLNREADPAGLAFWKNNIDKCNDPAQRPPAQTLIACIEVQRILTSGAFFLSIEFQQTGVFVRDFYVAALNRPVSGSQPLLVEFLRDVEAVQSGVVVGVGNWQQALDNNRTAFMNDFVMRTEFAGLYPTTDTPAQYVDKLYQHAAVTGTTQERLDAIGEFNGAATASDPGARARALLRITQNAAFRQREGNRAFVFMEYIGYLRRSPNDPPDGNFDGYNFWLTKLNQFNGDFLQAEMVKAFLSSIEYRQRFGQ